MAILATLFFGFVPMFFFASILYWMDRYEKEPLALLVGVFAWGLIIAAGSAYVINTIFGITIYAITGSEITSDFATGSISAPFVEEGLKGLAVLLVFLFFRTEFDSILDGIVYAGVVALGFAATENTIYIWRGYNAGGWQGLFQLVFIRVILVGWQHPVYTAFTGIGLAFARMNRSILVKFFAPIIGFSLAMLTHSLHNTLAGLPLLGDMTCFLTTFLDWVGVIFMLALITWAGWVEKRNIARHLLEEVQLGVISLAQYRTACSAWSQSYARLVSLFNGNYQSTSHFYQVCGELSHKKEQIRKLGDENGNTTLVLRYRSELAQLALTANS